MQREPEWGILARVVKQLLASGATMQSEFDKMLEDIIVISGYRVEFNVDAHDKLVRIWKSRGKLFAVYESQSSFTGALKKAWRELCG